MNYKIARRLGLVMMGVLLGATAVAYGASGMVKSDFAILSQAFAATGATVKSAEINGWVKVDTKAVNEAVLEKQVRKTFNQLGYDGNQVLIEKQQNNYFSQFRGEIRSDDFNLVVISQIIYPKPNKVAEAYIVINAVMGQQNTSDQEWDHKISKTLAELGSQPRINTCLVGWLDGKLNRNDLKHHLVLAFDSIQAVEVDQMFNDDFASITGYTPKLASFFKVKQEKVNVNMAMHYRPSEERTYVTIGSPVITREY
jgi:hypothetical protein